MLLMQNIMLTKFDYKLLEGLLHLPKQHRYQEANMISFAIVIIISTGL